MPETSPPAGWCKRYERSCYEMPLPLGTAEQCVRCPVDVRWQHFVIQYRDGQKTVWVDGKRVPNA